MSGRIPPRNSAQRPSGLWPGFRAKSGLLAAAVLLGACSGGTMAALMPGSEITVGGDVFSVSVDGSRAVAMNFATGTNNQERLYANAQAAIVQASGCVIAHFEQEPGVNTYRARLDCAAADD